MASIGIPFGCGLLRIRRAERVETRQVPVIRPVFRHIDDRATGGVKSMVLLEHRLTGVGQMYRILGCCLDHR
jgi:hypothetical protein